MNKTHGLSRTKLYQVWRDMISRCGNSKCKAYKNYGERGISVCNEWNDFIIFRIWALNNGYSESLQIDRIDNNGNYEPSNCRFTTRSINHVNKRHRDDVCINKRSDCSTYQIRIHRKPNTYCYTAKTHEEAIIIRDKALIEIDKLSI